MIRAYSLLSTNTAAFAAIARALVLGLASLPLASVSALAQVDYVRSQGPEPFTYDELLRLDGDEQEAELQAKLDKLRTTPFINNEAWYAGARPHKPNVPGLASTLRVVHWNIERGIRLPEIIELFTDQEAFLSRQRTTGEHIDAPTLT